MKMTVARMLVYVAWAITAGFALWGWSLWFREDDSKSLGMGVVVFSVVQALFAFGWLFAVNRSRTKSSRRLSWAAFGFAGFNAIAMTIALHWWDYQQTLASERRARELSAPPRDDARNTIRPETE